jgi:hypothetical protein
MPSQFKFDPTSIRITESEILADLSYPSGSRAAAKSRPGLIRRAAASRRAGGGRRIR